MVLIERNIPYLSLISFTMGEVGTTKQSGGVNENLYKNEEKY